MEGQGVAILVATTATVITMGSARAASWHLNDLTKNYMAVAPAGRLTAYAFNEEPSQHIVYRDANNHIQELWNNNHGWNKNDLTHGYAAPPAADDLTGWTLVDAHGNATQHIAYVGSDSHVHELWNAFHGWNNTDLTIATGAPLAFGIPSGYQAQSEFSEHVILRATNNLLYEAWNLGEGWHLNTISANTGSPVTASNPKGYFYEYEGSEHVVYVGDDHHVIELWWLGDGTGWHLNDLTVVTGAPVSDSELAPFSFNDHQNVNQETVIFRASDGHLHLLGNYNTSGWTDFDLTVASNAPVAVGSPAAYEHKADATRHVMFRGVNNHVYEIYSTDSGWFYNDLTTLVGAPATITDPIAYDYIEPSQHVVFVGTNGHIYEMWYK